jgi:hypothetical protein
VVTTMDHPGRATARRMAAKARTSATPVRLQMLMVGLIGLIAVTGLITFLAALEQRAATTAAKRSTEPLLVDAQSIDTSLSDADATIARSFLQGRVEPQSLRLQYMGDLTLASTRLSEASAAGTDPAVEPTVKTLAVDLPLYTGLIETASFNQRQALYPLAASYLGEANNLMRSVILPAATNLYRLEELNLQGNEQGATSVWPVFILLLLFAALVVALLYTHLWLSERFKRTLNLPVLAALVVVIVLGLVVALTFRAQRSDVTAAADGSGALVAYTQAQISGSAMTSDDELTLLTRDAVSSYQSNFQTASRQLAQLLVSAHPGATVSERLQLQAARRAFASYRTVHGLIRSHDPLAFPTAIDLASGSASTDLPQVAQQLTNDLRLAADSRHTAFQESLAGASTDLAFMMWLTLLATPVVVVLVLAGLRLRLAEYR